MDTKSNQFDDKTMVIANPIPTPTLTNTPHKSSCKTSVPRPDNSFPRNVAFNLDYAYTQEHQTTQEPKTLLQKFSEVLHCCSDNESTIANVAEISYNTNPFHDLQ